MTWTVSLRSCGPSSIREDDVADGLLIRADADERIGTGHVMRCLALAQAWRDARFGPVWLMSNTLPEGLRERYEREGANVCILERGGSALSRAVHDSGATWVVLDGYAFGVVEQRVARDECRRLLVVDDDGAAGEYVADLLVDHNVFAEERPYANRVAATRLLLGPRYALLRREFRAGITPKQTQVGAPRLLVTFGGADPAGLTLVALEALQGVDVEITVVLGPANLRRDDVQRAAAGAANVHVVWNAPNMRDLMDASDLALVAAGGTCLELACAGVPQVVIATAKNQRRVAKALVERGVARALADGAQVTAGDIRDGVLPLLRDEAIRQDMRTRGMALVDGYGAERVVEAMAELAV
jgi:UDP-2,4-diacetamido-2,4,6-trideoxy-beta-L-altropyranose hydrolase